MVCGINAPFPHRSQDGWFAYSVYEGVKNSIHHKWHVYMQVSPRVYVRIDLDLPPCTLNSGKYSIPSNGIVSRSIPFHSSGSTTMLISLPEPAGLLRQTAPPDDRYWFLRSATRNRHGDSLFSWSISPGRRESFGTESFSGKEEKHARFRGSHGARSVESEMAAPSEQHFW